MNSRTIENAIASIISDEAGAVQVITGTSANDRRAPSIRVIANGLSMPEGFPATAKERVASVIVAVVWESEEARAEEQATALFTRLQEELATVTGRIIHTDSDPASGRALDVLIHEARPGDVATENEGSLLVYAATYEIHFAFDNP